MSIATAESTFSQFFTPMWNEETFDPDSFPTMILNDERYGMKRPLTDEEYINLTHEFVAAASQTQTKLPFASSNFNSQLRTPFADAHNTRLQEYPNLDVRTQPYMSYDFPPKPPPPAYQVRDP